MEWLQRKQSAAAATPASALWEARMGRWPIKDVSCRDCGKVHQATRSGSRCIECRRRLSSKLTAERRRAAHKFSCRCGCGTPVKRDQYLRGHTPARQFPCKCGCGDMLYTNRYRRGHRDNDLAKALCECGCGNQVTRLGVRFLLNHWAGPCADCGTRIASMTAGRKARCEGCAIVAERRQRDDPVRKARQSEWNKRNALRIRAARHGMTVDEYWALYEAQGGRCAICRRPEGETRHTRFAIDHWHGHACERVAGSKRIHCGECVRGLLCGSCNTFIGQANDDPGLLRQAIGYIERASQLKLVA